MGPSTASFMHLLGKVYKVQKTSRNRATSKLQTNEDHHAKLLDEIWWMVPSIASFMHFLDKVYKVQKTLRNRAASKLQTNKDHHSKLLDEICLMVVPSTASFIHFLGKLYKGQKTLWNSQIVNYRQMRTTIRNYPTRSDCWYHQQPRSCIF